MRHVISVHSVHPWSVAKAAPNVLAAKNETDAEASDAGPLNPTDSSYITDAEDILAS